MESPPDPGTYCNASRNIGAVVVLAGRVLKVIKGGKEGSIVRAFYFGAL